MIDNYRRSGMKNPPKITENAVDNIMVLGGSLALAYSKPIDNTNAQQVRQRVREYFEICLHENLVPNIASLCLALHIDRVYFTRIINGNYAKFSEECIEEYRQAKRMLDSIMETHMLNGSVNPVSGIFLMKNMGYSDKQEVEIAPPSQLNQQQSADSIRKKY